MLPLVVALPVVIPEPLFWPFWFWPPSPPTTVFEGVAVGAGVLLDCTGVLSLDPVFPETPSGVGTGLGVLAGFGFLVGAGVGSGVEIGAGVARGGLVGNGGGVGAEGAVGTPGADGTGGGVGMSNSAKAKVAFWPNKILASAIVVISFRSFFMFKNKSFLLWSTPTKCV